MLHRLQPEAFDVEKGLQVQLIPNYNVWVSKSKLQFIMKEALTQKEGAPLFVLRRLIPLVFTWEELAASRGQGLNCKSTEDVMNKDPLDPTKVLVCKGQILHQLVYFSVFSLGMSVLCGICSRGIFFRINCHFRQL